MGKKDKREKAENHGAFENGGAESNEKHPKKKRKTTHKVKEQLDDGLPLPAETPTITVALPGSIIDNAQSLELATRLAGQVARAATIFRINEVVVFDSKNTLDDTSIDIVANDSDENESGAAFLIRILKYLETPQYLRKSLFPKHNSLRFVLSICLNQDFEENSVSVNDCFNFFWWFLQGLLPPLEAPHHLRKHEWAPYREGITREKLDQGSLVDVGLSKNIKVDQALEPGTRVTVEMGTNRNLVGGPRKVVPLSKTREEGMYWGYKVRYAANISSVFKNCPYEGGYDHRIGTSEHGSVINSSELILPSFKHLLIAFGGLAGLEECVEEDADLKGKAVRDIFDSYLNTCPHQGSRTIRTEEAIFISLQYFQEPIGCISHIYQGGRQ